MINGVLLNGAPLNAAGDVTYIISGDLFVIEQNVVIVEEAHDAVTINQVVGDTISGDLVTIEQNVRLWEGFGGDASPIITIEQEIVNISSGDLVLINQRVIDNSIATHLEKTGWDAVITLAGNIIPTEQIHGMISVDRTEGQAALAQFTIIPPLGEQALQYYQGKPVTIDVLTESGTRRIYTGLVDIPEVDLIERKITFKCTDRRTELINSQLGGVVGSIGYYSPLIFQDVKDTADQLEKRLSTTPQSVDFDVFGNYTLTSWFPKSVADFTLDDSDVYYSRPRIEIQSRARITNKVDISFQYRYSRLHHHQRLFSWTAPMASNIMLLLQYSQSMTFRSMVAGAATSAGWPIKGAIAYTPIWPSGWYGGIAWSTVSFTGGTFPKVDAFGDPVLDSDGNQVMESRITGGTDYGPLYCMGAQWTATTRWAQTVTENFTLSVAASQSVAQFGEIETAETYSVQDDFDPSIWENYVAYNDLGLGNNYFIKQDTNRNAVVGAMAVALNKARTTILSTHRDTRVIVSTFLWPEVDLKHTVRVDTDVVEAKGKVYSVNHSLNIGTGEAVTTTTLALFKATGSSSNSSFSAPPAPGQTVTYPTDPVILGNHFGQDPASTTGSENWTGMIGNSRPSPLAARTSFQEQFVVKVPAIPDTLRQEQSLSVGGSYNVQIPDDELDVFFN